MNCLMVVFTDNFVSKGKLKGYTNNFEYNIDNAKDLKYLLLDKSILFVKTKEGWFYSIDKIVKYGDFSLDEIRRLSKYTYDNETISHVSGNTSTITLVKKESEEELEVTHEEFFGENIKRVFKAFFKK